MSSGSPLAFPGSRYLAGWWRQLGSCHPRSFWVAHLLLHRVDALVRARRLTPLDRWFRILLDILAQHPQNSPESLRGRLHLDAPILYQFLRVLESDGLIVSDPGGGWSLTPRGNQARLDGFHAVVTHERRVFHFVESGIPGRPPHFIQQRAHPGIPWPAAEDWRFDPVLLSECRNRSLEWKELHGFPADVEAIAGLDSNATDETPSASPARIPDWRKVIVDHLERVPAVLVLTDMGGEERLIGFPFRQEGWVLDVSEPLFTLGAGWREVFPEVSEAPDLEKWRQAWRDWCQPRGLPVTEAEAALLERHEHRLRVSVSSSLAERLRATQGMVFKGEVWLHAGEGRLRAAAQVEIVETTSLP